MARRLLRASHDVVVYDPPSLDSQPPVNPAVSGEGRPANPRNDSPARLWSGSSGCTPTSRPSPRWQSKIRGWARSLDACVA